ncbi:hypothetical protein LZ30DRAFT_787764 [Colletotrichum cereale]|nr:hypothetical protein LZ30DRAFT_787764 [Colletotrichum cereale]
MQYLYFVETQLLNYNYPTLLPNHPHIRTINITTITITITTYFARLAAHPYATFGFTGYFRCAGFICDTLYIAGSHLSLLDILY